MTVYSTGAGEFGALAEDVAASRGCSVTSDTAEIAPGEPVVYVDSPSDIDESVLLALQRRLLAEGPELGGFSVVTGYDADLARRLYEADAGPDGRHAIFGHSSRESVPEDPETVVRVGDDVTTEAVERLREEGIASLSYNASAWPIHIKLSDGYICGYPTSREAGDYGDEQPFCVEDGERNCPLSDNLIPAETLAASHVFLASCATMIDNTPSGLPVHVGLGMLNGAESIIGSYRPSPSLLYESLLHYSLLRAGYSVVERTYLLNLNSHVNGITAFPYVPFGRPESRFDGAIETEFAVTNRDGTVRVEDVGGYVVDTTLPLPDGVSDAGRVYLRRRSERTGEGPPVCYLANPDGDAVRVVLYTGTRMDVDALELETAATPADPRRRSIAAASLANAVRKRRLEMLSDADERRVRNLRHQLHDLQAPTTREGHRLDAHFESRTRLDGVLGHVNSLAEGMVEDRSDGYPERHRYASRAVDGATFVADLSCHSCGRDVFVKEVELGTRNGTRALGVCPRCGYLFDVPTVPGGERPEYPVVTGDLWDSDADEREMGVEFTNPTEDHVDATFSPTLLRVGKETRVGDPIFHPGTVEQRLAPGETAAVDFTVDTRTLRDNQHYVVATVVGNLEVYNGRRMLLVGDKTSYLHPQYW